MYIGTWKDEHAPSLQRSADSDAVARYTELLPWPYTLEHAKFWIDLHKGCEKVEAVEGRKPKLQRSLVLPVIALDEDSGEESVIGVVGLSERLGEAAGACPGKEVESSGFFLL